MTRTIRTVLAFAFAAFLFQSCGGDTTEQTTSAPGPKPKMDTETAKAEESEVEDNGLGFGSITSVDLGNVIDGKLADKGKDIFKSLCAACHKMDNRMVGPAIADITKRRKPEWIMNMILHPEVMLKKDPTAKALLAEYKAPMINQNLSKDQARALLEYFRQYDNERK